MITTDVFAIPLADGYVVYAPLRKVAFLASAELINLLWRLRQGSPERLEPAQQAIVRFLRQIRLLGQNGDTPITTFDAPSFGPTHVTLFLTNRCNLRCIYCYASAGASSPADLSLPLAKRGIEYVVGNARRLGRHSIGLAYHGGGEPTLNWHVLVESLRFARQRAGENGLALHASMATNGVLSDAKRRWIVQNMDALSLSWDGLPAVQDMHRPRPSGRGSHAAVWQTIEALEQAAFPYGIRMTVTSRSVDRLAESIAFLLARARPKRIQAEPVYDLGRGRDEQLHCSPEAFVSAFREAKSISGQHAVEMYFSAARMDVLTNRFCRSCGEGFSITPHGDISACFEVYDREAAFGERFLFGRLDSATGRFVFDEAKLDRLRNHTVERIPWCDGCFCRWHCAGDCQNKAHHAMQDGEFKGHPRCQITQALVLDQILAKIHHSGGMLWAEGSPDVPILAQLLGEDARARAG
jgi:uncharacterized protein